MALLLKQTFVGRGPFPLDMLRLDECYPWTQIDVSKIYESIVNDDDQEREITVISKTAYNPSGWANFHWVPKPYN